METFVQAILLALIAGMCTTLGAASVLFVRKMHRLVLAGCLGLAAGVMIYVSLVDMVMESFSLIFDAVDEKSSQRNFKAWLITTVCYFGGWGLASTLDWCIAMCVEKIQLKVPELPEVKTAGRLQLKGEGGHLQVDPSSLKRVDEGHEIASDDAGDEERRHSGEKSTDAGQRQEKRETRCRWFFRRLVEMLLGTGPKTADQMREIAFAEERLRLNQHEVLKLGVFSCVALTVHNIPEGAATFFTTMNDPKVGTAFAVALGIHNIPEGISIAMPIYYSTHVKWPAFFFSFISGIAELIGALLAYAVVGSSGDIVLGCALAVTAGIMTNIGLNELLPAALKYDPCRQVVTKCVFLGSFIIASSLVLFELE